MKLSDKIIARLAYSYAKATNPDVKRALQSGAVTEQELLRRAQEGVAQADREIQAKKSQSRQSSSGGSRRCCSNCKHFSWGECWYYYEGHPGFTRSSYHRFDYHGETRQVRYPDETACDGYERKY